MRGDVIVLRPNRGPETRTYFGRPPYDLVSSAVGGSIEIVPMFDHVQLFDGTSTRAVVFCNSEAYMLDLPDNFWATAAWHYIIRAKGEKRPLAMLKGTVIIITGDDEFMEEL